MMAGKQNRRKECGSALFAEMTVALVLVAMVMVPLTLSLSKERREVRRLYYKAVAMEIVDGEMEVLAALDPADIPASGSHDINATAADNLPPGRFILTREDTALRLEWRSDPHLPGLQVVREITLP